MYSSKLPHTGFSAYSMMTKMAADFDAIDLTRASYSDYLPYRLFDLLSEHIRKGHNQYSPSEGIHELREIIADHVNKNNDSSYDYLTDISITAGGNQAINTAITAFVKEEEDVIILEPAYDCYAPIVKLNGAYPNFVQLKPETYTIDWQEVNQSVTSRTSMIIINSPHNPSGHVFTEEDYKQLIKLVSGTKILILSDEVFDNILFNGNKHLSVAQFPELKERSIIISSLGKPYNLNGWHIGYCLAPEELMKEYRKIAQYQLLSISTPLQYAFADFLKEGNTNSEFRNMLNENRNHFEHLLQETKFRALPSQGTYFLLMDYAGVSEDKDKAFATKLTTDHGIASVPLSTFYHDNINTSLLRVCFAKPIELLEQVVRKLKEIKE